MAETLVLAELSIDSSGVVSGVAVAGGALDTLGKRTEDAGKKSAHSAGFFDLLSKRMFSLKTAAVALIGSFSLAGIILHLSNLATTLVTGTDAWKRWTEAATDALKALSGGEGMIARISRHLSDASKGTGITPGLLTSESVTKLLALRAKVESEMDKIPAGMIFGATAKDILARQVLNKDLDDITRALVKLQEQSGLTQGQFDELFGTTLSDAIVQATKLEEGFTDQLHKTHEPIAKAVKLTGDWEEELTHAGNALRNLSADLKPSMDLLEQWEAAVALVIAQSEAMSGPAGFSLHQNKINELTDSYENWGIVATAAYEAIGAAAAAGIASQEAATRVQMALLAIDAILRGKIELAKSVGELAAGNYGKATLHGIAAGLYFAAAAFYGKGAIVGTAVRGGSGGGSAGGQPQDQREPTRQYYISFPGVTIIGGNEASVGSQIKEYIRTAERRGG